MADTLAEMLTTLRERARLNKSEAARRVGVARNMIYAWEDGTKIPDPDSVATLCEVYGASRAERVAIAIFRTFGVGELPPEPAPF
jgi:transcriptional regulator with XRE-family HTH domain